MAIKKLYEHSVYDREGNCYGNRMPNNGEIMNKINEIIDIINCIAEKQQLLADDILKYKSNVKET